MAHYHTLYGLSARIERVILNSAHLIIRIILLLLDRARKVGLGYSSVVGASAHMSRRRPCIYVCRCGCGGFGNRLTGDNSTIFWQKRVLVIPIRLRLNSIINTVQTTASKRSWTNVWPNIDIYIGNYRWKRFKRLKMWNFSQMLWAVNLIN